MFARAQSGAELAALAAARQALQEAALHAHFEAAVAPQLALRAVRKQHSLVTCLLAGCSRALRPRTVQAEEASRLPTRAGAARDAALESHAALCRLAHALLLRAAPHGRRAAVIARREPT